MLLDPDGWSLAQRADSVLAALSPDLSPHVTAETHACAVELQTGVHASVAGAVEELRRLRAELAAELEPLGLRAASAGTHPFARWPETVVSAGERHQFVYGSMRELARREPTFALHVHVGIPTPEGAIRLINRLRAYLPLLLALSANSPFWQGRDTGLASARTPLFQVFPRVGIPREFRSYDEYVDTVDLLIRCGAVPEPTFLWWDIRAQPRFGTVEVRIMDAQSAVEDTAALLALVQCLARVELESGFVSRSVVTAPEVIAENRFLAERDGVDARLIDPDREARVPVRAQVEELVAACASHARALGCAEELASVLRLAECNGTVRQRSAFGEGDRLPAVVAGLAESFTAGAGSVGRLTEPV